MGNYNNKTCAISSCALDWVPGVGTVKGIYELEVKIQLLENL